MKTATNPRRLVTVPFSKTQCGVDFYINTGRSEEIRGVLTEHPLFRTDFFEFFFLGRAQGTLLLGSSRIELHDDMVLLLSPHEQQQWLVDEAELDYTFLIFREDFMRTFLSDKLFVYRLLYCYQSDTPPWFDAPRERFGEYLRLLAKIKTELQAPTSDSYNLIVAVLYYLLVTLNRDYAARRAAAQQLRVPLQGAARGAYPHRPARRGVCRDDAREPRDSESGRRGAVRCHGRPPAPPAAARRGEERPVVRGAQRQPVG